MLQKVGAYLRDTMVSESKQKTKFCNQKVCNTGLKSSLRAIERYAYCLGYILPQDMAFRSQMGTVLYVLDR